MQCSYRLSASLLLLLADLIETSPPQVLPLSTGQGSRFIIFGQVKEQQLSLQKYITTAQHAAQSAGRRILRAGDTPPDSQPSQQTDRLNQQVPPTPPRLTSKLGLLKPPPLSGRPHSLPTGRCTRIPIRHVPLRPRHLLEPVCPCQWPPASLPMTQLPVQGSCRAVTGAQRYARTLRALRRA